MWRRVGLAVLDDPVVSWLGESMAASSGSTSPEPTCRLVASQSSQQGRRIWTNKDQPQGSGSGLRTRIRTNNQDQDRGSRIRSSRPQLQDRGLWSPQRSIWREPSLIVSLSPTSVRWHWCQRQPNQVTSDMYGGETWVVYNGERKAAASKKLWRQGQDAVGEDTATLQLWISRWGPGNTTVLCCKYFINTKYYKYLNTSRLKKINGEIVIFDTIVIQTTISRIWSVISFLKNTKCL